MATLTATTGVAQSPPAIEQRKFRPVIWWAWLGAAALVVEVSVLWRWIASGDARAVPIGPTDAIPTYMKVAARSWEIGGLFACAVFLYFFLIRPWRRAGRITVDGMFCIAFFTVTWQDPILNIFQPWFNYNGYFINWGTWLAEMPFRVVPRPQFLVEPLVMDAPTYIWLVFGMAVVGSVIMRQAKTRWPQLGTFGVIAVCFVTFVVFDFIFEPPFMLLGLWVYPGSIKSMTLFHGHYYQFPLYEPLIASMWWTAFASIRYFKNDRGQTLMERGIEHIRGGERKRTGLRMLACVGIVNVAFLAYNIPAAFLGLYADEWPEDIVKRAYFTTGYCGPTTAFACPGPDVPIHRPGSAHVGPDGELVVPPGVKIP